jgi:hypothetical protein
VPLTPTRRAVLTATSALALSPALPELALADTTSPRLPARTIRARRRFFDARNVDDAGRVRRDRVILSWFGVSNFAMAIGGRVLLLDAWIPRGAYSGYVPADVQDLIDLHPTHVFIGHGHFDHAAHAPTIAAATGALVVGTAEHCTQVEMESGGSARTSAVVPAGAAEGTTAALTLGPVAVDVVKHVHSAHEGPTGQSAPLLLPPDLLPCLEHPPTAQDALSTGMSRRSGLGCSSPVTTTIGNRRPRHPQAATKGAYGRRWPRCRATPHAYACCATPTTTCARTGSPSQFVGSSVEGRCRARD